MPGSGLSMVNIKPSLARYVTSAKDFEGHGRSRSGPVAQSVAKERGAESVGGLGVHLREPLGVEVERDADLGVAQLLADPLRVPAAGPTPVQYEAGHRAGHRLAGCHGRYWLDARPAELRNREIARPRDANV